MKIKEFAESRKLSNQAIYKALNRAGYSAKQLTDRNGNISQKGIRILNKLFPDDLQQDPEPGAGDQQPGQQEPGAAAAGSSAGGESKEAEYLRERIKELENQCSEWKTKSSEWETRYFELQQSKEREAQEFRRLLYQYKETENQKLIAAAGEPEKKGFFKRLFHGKKTEPGSIS